MKEQPQRPAELDYSGLIEKYGGENFTIDNARRVCNYLTTHCKMRDRYIRFLEGRIASEIVAKYQSGSTEQPQKPEESLQPEDNLASAINRLAKNRTAWMLYAQSLERENTALKERVAALENLLIVNDIEIPPEVK